LRRPRGTPFQLSAAWTLGFLCPLAIRAIAWLPGRDILIRHASLIPCHSAPGHGRLIGLLSHSPCTGHHSPSSVNARGLRRVFCHLPHRLPLGPGTIRARLPLSVLRQWIFHQSRWVPPYCRACPEPTRGRAALHRSALAHGSASHEGKYQVRFLRLAIGRPTLTQAVLAAALRPSRLKDPHSWDAFSEDRPSGEVIDYEFSQLDKGAADTRLLLFNHGVLLGDSGAPVVLPGSQAAVGLVEGRWLRPDAASLAAATDQPNSGVGAAILIHYAIALLQRNGVSWHSLEEQNPAGAADADPTEPLPLSLISATHPSLTLEGGEVVLDARVDPTGQLADIKTVAGPTAFVDKVLSAVDTWSFVPSPFQDHAKENRIGVVFQFDSPGVLPNQSPIRHYQMPSGDTSPRAALPVLTV